MARAKKDSPKGWVDDLKKKLQRYMQTTAPTSGSVPEHPTALEMRRKQGPGLYQGEVE